MLNAWGGCGAVRSLNKRFNSLFREYVFKLIFAASIRVLGRFIVNITPCGCIPYLLFEEVWIDLMTCCAIISAAHALFLFAYSSGAMIS
jgi:hypothetical protein